MSDEQDKLKLSLEPPKLFGRKRKSAGEADTPEPVDAVRPAPRPTTPAVEIDDPHESTTVIDEAEPAPADDPADDPADEELTAVIEDVKAAEASPAEAPADAADVDSAEPVVEPEPAPVVARRPETAPRPAPVKKGPTARKPAPEQTRAERIGATPVEVEPEPVSDVDLEDAEIAAMADRGPLLDTYPATAITGLAVGAAMVVLTWLSLRGCEAVRGTASCGGGPGFLLLVATFVVCVLVGSSLLKAFDVPDPGSSSFLAVGLVSVVALLFLIDFLDSWTMLIVIPVISVGGYLASVWVTKTFVEPADT